jgi:predicted DNA-binding transcriptional regulator AlpA
VEPAFVRQKQAAQYLGMSEQGLIKLLRKGSGPPRIKKDRAVYFEVASLRHWMLKDLVGYDRGHALQEREQ